MEIILASASPRRKELLKYITPDFKAVSLDIDETIPPDIAPDMASEYLALLKARAASEKYPEALIIGCDTTVICESNILGKPHGKQQCIECIGMLSGKTHKVITGCAIIKSKKEVSFSETTEVNFRELSEKEINDYADTDEPYDKAGGYGIQGKGSELIRSINGDFFNVVGLPVTRLFNEMKIFLL